MQRECVCVDSFVGMIPFWTLREVIWMVWEGGVGLDILGGCGLG